MDLKEALLLFLTTQVIRYGEGMCSWLNSVKQYWLPGIREEFTFGIDSFLFSVSGHSQVG